MRQIGGLIADVLKDIHNENRLAEVREEVTVLCGRFPLYAERIRDNR